MAQDGILRADWQSALVLARRSFLPPETLPPGTGRRSCRRLSGRNATDRGFAKLGGKTVFQAVKEIFADQPDRRKPVIEHSAPVPWKVMAADAVQAAVQDVAPAAVEREPEAARPSAVPAIAPVSDSSDTGGIETAAAGLLEAGGGFIGSLAHGGASGSSSGSRLEQILSGLFTRDADTNRAALSISLPQSVSRERLASAISGVANVLGRVVSGAVQLTRLEKASLIRSYPPGRPLPVGAILAADGRDSPRPGSRRFYFPITNGNVTSIVFGGRQDRSSQA